MLVAVCPHAHGLKPLVIEKDAHAGGATASTDSVDALLIMFCVITRATLVRVLRQTRRLDWLLDPHGIPARPPPFLCW